MEVDTMSVEEKLNQAKGAIKEGVGKVTDDKKTEKEGAAEKVVSKVKEVAEDAKEAVHLKHGNCSTRNLRLFYS